MNEPIPLEPDETSRPPAGKPRGPHLEAPGLMDDFDEDADFEHDPELDAVVRGIPVGARPAAAPSPSEPTAKTPLFAWLSGAASGAPLSPSPAWKAYASIGGVLSLAAATFAGVYANSDHWAHVLLALYRAALHTGTGVAALIITSLLLGRPIGRFESGIAKMLFAVSLFLIVYSLKIPLTPGKLEEVVLGGAAYFGGLIFAFKAPPRDAAVIGGAHFGLALLVTLGSLLTAVTASGAAG